MHVAEFLHLCDGRGDDFWVAVAEDGDGGAAAGTEDAGRF